MTLDWLLSQSGGESETETLFNQLMCSIHDQKSATGGLKPLDYMKRQTSSVKQVAEKKAIEQIEAKSGEVDATLERMKRELGERVVESMSAKQLYLEYQRFVAKTI